MSSPPAPERRRPRTHRDLLVDELRRRYLAGTLDDVLVPDHPSLERLIEDLRRRDPAR